MFAGGFTLEAAEAVGAGDGDLDERDVLDLARAAGRKVAGRAGARPLPQLETVRQYAQERLEESGDEREARRRHLAFYVALAQRARPELVGPTQGAWLARFDLERDNLLAAHAWFDRDEADAQLGLVLVQSIRLYWLNRGLLGLGHRVTVEALARPAAKARTSTRGQAAFTAGQLSFFIGRYEQTLEYLGESLSIARETGDTDAVARALTLLGVACLGQEDLATARGYLEEALALARTLGDQVRVASTLNAMAELQRTDGALDKAQALYEESLSIRRKLGDRDAVAIDLLNLTVVAIGRGLGEDARRSLQQAHALAIELGSKKLGQAVLDATAGLCAFLRHNERAARFHGASTALMERMGLQREPAVMAFLRPLTAQVREALGPDAYAAAENEGRTIDHDAALAEAGAWLAGAKDEVRLAGGAASDR